MQKLERARNSGDKDVAVAPAAVTAAAPILEEVLGAGAAASVGTFIRLLQLIPKAILLPFLLSGDTMQESPDIEDGKEENEEEGKDNAAPQTGQPGGTPPEEPRLPDVPTLPPTKSDRDGREGGTPARRDPARREWPSQSGLSFRFCSAATPCRRART